MPVVLDYHMHSDTKHDFPQTGMLDTRESSMQGCGLLSSCIIYGNEVSVLIFEMFCAHSQAALCSQCHCVADFFTSCVQLRLPVVILAIVLVYISSFLFFGVVWYCVFR